MTEPTRVNLSTIWFGHAPLCPWDSPATSRAGDSLNWRAVTASTPPPVWMEIVRLGITSVVGVALSGLALGVLCGIAWRVARLVGGF